jgi:hypothetical protein
MRLPFIGYVADWEFKLRRNGHIRLANFLGRYDTWRGKRD